MWQDKINTVWQGDCLELMKEMPNKCIDLIVTDPPYLMEWQSNRRFDKHKKIKNDDNSDWLKQVFEQIFRVLKEDCLCLSFYGWPEADKFVSIFKSSGFELKSHLVWVKNNIGLGWFTRGKHEQAYLLAKGQPNKPKNPVA